MKTRLNQILTLSALCLAAAALAIALWTSAMAQDEAPQAALAIPTTLNYQGYLREPDGSLTTGTHDITAKIYNIATGGSPLYTTTLPGVTVRDGLFNIVLGDTPPLPSTVFANAPLYIGISLNGGAELIPRQRLHAVPWAFQASTLVNNATIQGLTCNGNVMVNGDTTSNGNVTVNGDTTISGNMLVTGSLSHPGETFVGPHFLGKSVKVKGWGECNTTPPLHFDASNHVPEGATAVILEYKAYADSLYGSDDLAIYILKEFPSQGYILTHWSAAGDTDALEWGGQGIYPINDERMFLYIIAKGDLVDSSCEINLIGYFK